MSQISVQRCQACLGSKKLLNRGLFVVECHHCKGKGTIEVAVDEIQYLRDQLPTCTTSDIVKTEDIIGYADQTGNGHHIILNTDDQKESDKSDDQSDVPDDLSVSETIKVKKQPSNENPFKSVVKRKYTRRAGARA
ncbi:MAG: hypothetical protein ACYC6W_10830 [Nitrosotalea sp.]